MNINNVCFCYCRLICSWVWREQCFKEWWSKSSRWEVIADCWCEVTGRCRAASQEISAAWWSWYIISRHSEAHSC